MIDLVTALSLSVVALLSVLAHFAIARWLARRIHGATSDEALRGYTRQIRSIVTESLSSPEVGASLRGMVDQAIPGVVTYIGEHGEELAGALGDALDGWAQSPTGQARLRELLGAVTLQIGPAVESLLSDPTKMDLLLGKLTPKLRQEFARWVGSQKGGVSTAIKAATRGRGGGDPLTQMALDIGLRMFGQRLGLQGLLDGAPEGAPVGSPSHPQIVDTTAVMI